MTYFVEYITSQIYRITARAYGPYKIFRLLKI